jgi:hypothetical protein
MGIYQSAVIIALVIMGLAIALALVPEILQRLPRRHRRLEKHHVKLHNDELQARPRPKLKRETPPDSSPPPTDPS